MFPLDSKTTPLVLINLHYAPPIVKVIISARPPKVTMTQKLWSRSNMEGALKYVEENYM